MCDEHQHVEVQDYGQRTLFKHHWTEFLRLAFVKIWLVQIEPSQNLNPQCPTNYWYQPWAPSVNVVIIMPSVYLRPQQQAIM